MFRFKPVSFKQWVREYKKEYDRELKEYLNQPLNHGLIPKYFDRELLHQFISYKNDVRTQQLVTVTWVLAIATITLSVLTIFLK